MDTRTLRMAYRVDKDHSDSVSGGTVWTRREEAADIADGRVEIGQFRLEAYALIGLNFTTNELLHDSPRAVASLVASGFQTELGSRLREMNG